MNRHALGVLRKAGGKASQAKRWSVNEKRRDAQRAALAALARGREAARKAWEAGVCPQCGGIELRELDPKDPGLVGCPCGWAARLEPVLHHTVRYAKDF